MTTIPTAPPSTTAPAPAPSGAKPMRADAQRNHDRLLAVAAEVLMLDAEVPLETIAERAGVGIGTLYRHFPNRGALIEAAYRQEVEALCDAAPVLLEETPTALAALREWMGRFVHYVTTKRGLGGALRDAVGSDSPLFAETKQRILDALTVLLDACVAEGSVRRDVDATDAMLAMWGVWVVPDGPEWEKQVRRLLDLVVDSLRFGA